MFCFIRSIKVLLDPAICRMHQGQKYIFVVLFLLHKRKLSVIFLMVLQRKAVQWLHILICSNEDIKSRGNILCTAANTQSD